MSSAREVRQRVEQVRSNILGLAGEVMLENKDPIVALVIEQQYDKGIDGNNEPLKPYTRNYAKKKSKLGVLQGHADYSLSGAMQAAMTLTIDGDTYDINSPIEVNGHRLSDLLKKRDTQQSFDLTPENKKAVWEIIKEPFMEKVNNILVID